METLSAISLPPGFGFHPTDVELISHYLKKKVLGKKIEYDVIPEVDIYKNEPWDLPGKCHVPTRDCKWHFFAARDRKYPNGSRTNRATEAGYWKSTGKDRNIKFQNRVIGTKKTLVFHEGRPPCGKRTDWIMHEYFMDENECKHPPGMKDAYVLCRVTKRDGFGPEGEDVPPQTEEAINCPKQPKDVSASAVAEESSLSENVEDIDALVTELFDPNFPAPLYEIKSEPKISQEGLSSFAPKQEPEDSGCLPEPEDPDFLLSDDIYSILQSHDHNFDDIFGGPEMATFDSVGDHFLPVGNYHEVNLVDVNSEKKSTTLDPNPNVNNVDSGIELRERRARSSTGIPNHSRIRLQVSKMESRNGQSICQTVEIVEQGCHLDPIDENQPNQESKALSTASSKKGLFAKKVALRKRSVGSLKAESFSDRNPDDMSCFQGLVRGLCDFSSWCSSASMNCFFMGACMMGAAALISYFLLRDARRFLGSFSALDL